MTKNALIFIEDGSFTYDNRVKRQADALVENGWNVTIISPSFPGDPFYRRLHDRLRSYHYPKPQAESAPGHIVEHSVSLIMGILLTAWVALRHGFTIFHACNPLDILWLVALPYRIFGKKFIFDQHDLCPELYLSRKGTRESDLFYRALLFLERRSYQIADAVIATNESYQETALVRGRRRNEDVFVVRNGPDLDRLQKTEPRAGLKGEREILVGYLGNMNFQDGVDLLVETARYVRDELDRHDIKFVLVGGGSCQEALAEQSRAMGLQDTVTFTGRIPDDDMLATISACDLCVQPDPPNPLNDKSTMNKVMEYMALEKPVVTFDLTETRVSCGEAALYARPGDVADLADKIVYLADKPQERERMSQLGRKRVETTLSWEYSVPNLLAAYQHAMR